MKQKWSAEWKSSVQPRKQRKYRHNAPLHVRHKFLGARLSTEHMRQLGRRSIPVRKGDEVRIMRGKSRGLKGVVERVDVKRSKIYVDGIIVKKVDGSEVMKALQPSNLMITKPNMDDKKRQSILKRTEERSKVLRSQKPKEKPKEKPKDKPKEELKQDKKAEEKKEAKQEEMQKEAKTDDKTGAKPDDKKEAETESKRPEQKPEEITQDKADELKQDKTEEAKQEKKNENIREKDEKVKEQKK